MKLIFVTGLLLLSGCDTRTPLQRQMDDCEKLRGFPRLVTHYEAIKNPDGTIHDYFTDTTVECQICEAK